MKTTTTAATTTTTTTTGEDSGQNNDSFGVANDPREAPVLQYGYDYVACARTVRRVPCIAFNPVRTAVPFWGQTTQSSSCLSPKRDCGSKGVNVGHHIFLSSSPPKTHTVTRCCSIYSPFFLSPTFFPPSEVPKGFVSPSCGFRASGPGSEIVKRVKMKTFRPHQK